MYARSIRARAFAWTWADAPPPALAAPEGLRARLQFRHRMADIPCVVRPGAQDWSEGGEGGPAASTNVTIEMEEPQKAVAPGQVAVLWVNDVCLGCGVIDSAA